MYRSRYGAAGGRVSRSTKIRNILLVVLGFAALFAVGFFVLEPLLDGVLHGEDPTSSAVSSEIESRGEVSEPPSDLPSGEDSSGESQPEDDRSLSYAVYLTADRFSSEDILALSLQQAKAQGAGLIMLELKGKDGKLAYRSDLNEVKRIDGVKEEAVALEETLSVIRGAGFEVGFALTVFDEDYTASKLRKTAVKYGESDTTRWLNYEHQYRQDPGLMAAKEYQWAIVEEVLTYRPVVLSLHGCHYPVWGDLSSCTVDKTQTRQENIVDFLSEVYLMTTDAGVGLNVVLPADVAVGDRHSRWGYYGYPEDLQSIPCDSLTADLRLNGIFNRYYGEITVDGVGYANLARDGETSGRLLYGAAFTETPGIHVLTDGTVGDGAACFALFNALGAGQVTYRLPWETAEE